MHRSEPSRLQSLALQLADKVNNFVDSNERILETKQGNFFLRGANQVYNEKFAKQFESNVIFRFRVISEAIDKTIEAETIKIGIDNVVIAIEEIKKIIKHIYNSCFVTLFYNLFALYLTKEIKALIVLECYFLYI